MDCDAFRPSAPGSLVPIQGYDIRLGTEYSHYAFVPDLLPSEIALTQRTYKLVTEADRALGRLDAAAARLPNPSLLVRPTLFREAVSTSAIEGTHAPLVDVLEADLVDDKKPSSAVHEVLNYVRASELALDLLKKKPICLTLIAELQKVLVSGTRGDSYDAGQLRAKQVYIGDPTKGIEQSRFVPPPHGDILVQGVSEWEKWVNAEDDIPLLVKAALAHYQFETLHPFSDGNGRLGRLIILLQLLVANALHYPILNLAPFIQPKKEEYKDLLLACSQTGDFDPWIQFFAEGVAEEANDSHARIEELIQLRASILDALRADKAKGVVLDIVDDLIAYPVITASHAAQFHNVTYPPALRAIERLERLGVLKEITGKSYGRTYVCRQVIRIVNRPPLSGES